MTAIAQPLHANYTPDAAHTVQFLIRINNYSHSTGTLRLSKDVKLATCIPPVADKGDDYTFYCTQRGRYNIMVKLLVKALNINSITLDDQQLVGRFNHCDVSYALVISRRVGQPSKVDPCVRREFINATMDYHVNISIKHARDIYERNKLPALHILALTEQKVKSAYYDVPEDKFYYWMSELNKMMDTINA